MASKHQNILTGQNRAKPGPTGQKACQQQSLCQRGRRRGCQSPGRRQETDEGGKTMDKSPSQGVSHLSATMLSDSPSPGHSEQVGGRSSSGSGVAGSAERLPSGSNFSVLPTRPFIGRVRSGNAPSPASIMRAESTGTGSGELYAANPFSRSQSLAVGRSGSTSRRGSLSIQQSESWVNSVSVRSFGRRGSVPLLSTDGVDTLQPLHSLARTMSSRRSSLSAVEGVHVNDYIARLKSSGSNKEANEQEEFKPPPLSRALSVNKGMFNKSIKVLTESITECITAAMERPDLAAMLSDETPKGKQEQEQISDLFSTFKRIGALRRTHNSIKTILSPTKTDQDLEVLRGMHDPDAVRKLTNRFTRATQELSGHRDWLKPYVDIPRVNKDITSTMDEAEKHKFQHEKLQRGRVRDLLRKMESDKYHDQYASPGSSSPMSATSSPRGRKKENFIRGRQARGHSEIAVKSAAVRTKEFRHAKMEHMSSDTGNKTARF